MVNSCKNPTVSTDTFYIFQEIDSETLQQTYVPKWNVINDSALDDIEVCRSMVDQLAPPGFLSQLRGMDYDQLFAEFNVGVARQACFSTEEMGVEIASLKEQLSLKEAEAAKAICLSGQVATIESAETAQVNELIEEKKIFLEKKVAVLESTNATKETELTPLTTQTVKLTQDFFELGLSCDELSVKASPLEAEKDRLVDQVSLLEGTCSGLCDEVSGYKLFKEQIEVVQDE
ncbi:hypothetical protein Tco_0653380 [Tanacetum coccineum]|uniref:Uncharacterized protein n=1 Tax=Tanacetum coccineum TaxID=301880 RepID=A0ABQ4X080_9ASTR